MHDQRLKDLRQLSKDLEDDDWRYPNVENLIGLKWSLKPDASCYKPYYQLDLEDSNGHYLKPDASCYKPYYQLDLEDSNGQFSMIIYGITMYLHTTVLSLVNEVTEHTVKLKTDYLVFLGHNRNRTAVWNELWYIYRWCQDSFSE